MAVVVVRHLVCTLLTSDHSFVEIAFTCEPRDSLRWNHKERSGEDSRKGIYFIAFSFYRLRKVECLRSIWMFSQRSHKFTAVRLAAIYFIGFVNGTVIINTCFMSKQTSNRIGFVFVSWSGSIQYNNSSLIGFKSFIWIRVIVNSSCFLATSWWDRLRFHWIKTVTSLIQFPADDSLVFHMFSFVCVVFVARMRRVKRHTSIAPLRSSEFLFISLSHN